jgi:hypothetical protein
MNRKLMMLGGGGLAAALIAVSGYSAHSQSHQSSPQQTTATNDSWKSKWAPANGASQHAGLRIQLDAKGNHVVPPPASGQTFQAKPKASLSGGKTVNQLGAVKLVVPARGSEELRPLTGADGKSEVVRLHGKYHSAMKATIGPDGKLQYACNEEGAQ